MLPKTWKTCIPLFIMLSSQLLTAQVKYSRVRINLPQEGMRLLIQLELDLDHGEYNRTVNTFTTTLHQADINKLKNAGVLYDILVEDETAAFQLAANSPTAQHEIGTLSQKGKLHFENSCSSHLDNIVTPVGFIPGSYGGYYTFAEMQKRIDSLVNHYPSIVQKIILPQTTAGGRPLIVVKISDNVTTNENEAEVLYTGLHHAREGMSMMNLFYFMQYLAENYGTDPKITALVNNRELFFMPCVNPDGYVFNETNTPGGGGMWRKNRRNNGSGNFGVDLNRNYNVDWGVTGANINISTNPSSDSYIGPSAFSEPETQAIRQFAQARHLKLVIDHHAYGNYYVTPYGVPANHPFTAADSRFYKYASALMARYNSYFAGDGMQTVNYYAVGNSRDYHMAGDIGVGNKQKTYGYTVEIGPSALGFWPSAANITPIARSMFFANLQMAYMAGAYYEIQDRNNLAVNSTSGNFAFTLLRTGISTGPVAVNIIPLQNIQSIGAGYTNSGIAGYGDTVQASIPYTLANGITAGEKIRFVYQVNTGGIILNDTIERIYQPIVLLNEGMEGSLTNWTLNGSWGTTTSAAYNGLRSLSESPAGNYSNGLSSAATYNLPLDLSDATAAYLSFWVKHRSQNGIDKLQVELSATGPGAGSTFTASCGQQTIAEGSAPALTGIRENWTREIIDLENYLGATNVGLRFRFVSNGSGTDDGFNIDNIEVVKSTSLVLDGKPTLTVKPAIQQAGREIISLSPNPASDLLQLRLTAEVNTRFNISINDINGIRVRSVEVSVNGKVNQLVNIADLKSQIYIITITNQRTGDRSLFRIFKQ